MDEVDVGLKPPTVIPLCHLPLGYNSLDAVLLLSKESGSPLWATVTLSIKLGDYDF